VAFHDVVASVSRRETLMQVMGENRWSFEVDPHVMVAQALQFAEQVKEQGIAELHGAWIAEDEGLMWCSWDTEDLAALQGAFNEMNRRSGLESRLTGVRTFYSTLQDVVLV
jgi:hypothetical protein